jgi:hypothetical protein
MRYAVYIGATGGPVRIERFVAEGVPLSEVFVGRSVEPLAPMAAAFDNFMQPGRPPEKLFGSAGSGGWRMDLSAPIDSGDSWELAVLIAYGLSRLGRLAGPDDKADASLWLTGRVNADLDVGPVGHVEEKLRASGDLLDVAGTPCTCFVPAGSGVGGQRAVEVRNVMEIIEHLGLDTGRLEQGFPRRRGMSSGMKVAVATLMAALLVVSTQLGWFADVPDIIPVAVAPAAGKPAVSISVSALRPAAGSSCAAVHFNATPAIQDRLAPADGVIDLKSGPTLCGIAVSVDARPEVSPGRTFAAFSGGLPAEIHGRPGEPDAPVTVDRHHEWTAMLPVRVEMPLEMVVIAGTQASGTSQEARLTVRVLP